MATVTMTMEEYLQLLNGLSSEPPMVQEGTSPMVQPKRKMTAYQRRYKANFRKIESEYKKKNGEWKKNGFRRAVQEAHRLSKK